MDGFNTTGQLAAASRSLGGVPYYPNRCVHCGSCPPPGRSNLLTAPGTNGYRIAGPYREIGLELPGSDTYDEMIVEVQMPIEKMSASSDLLLNIRE